VSSGLGRGIIDAPNATRHVTTGPPDLTEGATMIKLKTFTTPIKMFATVRELEELDRDVTAFLVSEKAATVLALSDATTTGESGETIGLIRSIVYTVD